MNISKRIEKYKAAFYNQSARGNVLYVSDLNSWFADCGITRSNNQIILTGRTPFFDSDPFTVMTELQERLKLAIKAAGYPALEISIHPTENKITYSYENDAAIEAEVFLIGLRHYVKQGFRIKEKQPAAIKPER